MTNQPIQYAALIPGVSEQPKLAQLVEFAAQTPGFKPINPRDAHLTVGFNPEGFDNEAIETLQKVRNVELQSVVAQGLKRKHGNLHLIYSKNTQQIAVAIEFPSHTVNELKAKLKHTHDGRLSLSHMTIGVLDAETLGVDLQTLNELAKRKDFDAVQSKLDTAFSAFLDTEAGAPLKALAEAPIGLTMEKVHASAHTECPLDITEHPNPISTRENALDNLKQNVLTAPIQTVSSWVDRLFGNHDAPARDAAFVR